LEDQTAVFSTDSWGARCCGIMIVRRKSGMPPPSLGRPRRKTAHGRSNLRELIARSESGGYDLVSLMARLSCRSLWEHLLIPALVFFFFMLYPPCWVAERKPRASGAAGGCMLVRPAVLERIGGSDRIRNEIIDNCALARAAKPHGRGWLGLSAHVRSIREYRSRRPLWDMVTRTAFARLRYSPVVLALTLLLLLLTYLVPPALLMSREPVAMALGAAAWLAMSAAFLPVLRFHESPLVLSLLLPLIALFYSAATIASAVLHRRGRGGYWKGRYQAPALSSHWMRAPRLKSQTTMGRGSALNG
jgi:hopene-associated glycosyltransferase HpnB